MWNRWCYFKIRYISWWRVIYIKIRSALLIFWRVIFIRRIMVVTVVAIGGSLVKILIIWCSLIKSIMFMRRTLIITVIDIRWTLVEVVVVIWGSLFEVIVVIRVSLVIITISVRLIVVTVSTLIVVIWISIGVSTDNPPYCICEETAIAVVGSLVAIVIVRVLAREI